MVVATEMSTATSTAFSVLASTMGRIKAVVAAARAATIIAAGLKNDLIPSWSGACCVVLPSDISLCPTALLRLMTDSNAIVKECEQSQWVRAIYLYGHSPLPPSEKWLYLVGVECCPVASMHRIADRDCPKSLGRPYNVALGDT